MVSIAGDGNIIVKIDAEALAESLRSVLLALVCELLRSFADIRVDDALQAALPCSRNLLGLALGYSLYVRSHDVEELAEVGK